MPSATRPITLTSLPPLISVEEVRRRLSLVFPDAYPDRALLVGEMAARVIFVFLYGGFSEGSARFLRPSVVYFFTKQQAHQVSDLDRQVWLQHAFKSGFRPMGSRWYADTSRESIRDDLIRNRLLNMGMVGRREGVPTTSSAPVYFLRSAFAALFDPGVEAAVLGRAIDEWRLAHLSATSLRRMALKAQGVEIRLGDVFIDLPDGARIRVGAGPSSPILKALIEQFAPRWLRKPVVLWISASDLKAQPQFERAAAAIGLRFDTRNELPDLVLADLEEPTRFLFCEIVATDGPVTEERRIALTAIALRSGMAPDSLHFVTAFEDRAASAFRKTFSRVAPNSDVWFSTEPDLLITLRRHKASDCTSPSAATPR